MNEVAEIFSNARFGILGFPCNQFGHQENCTNDEILPCLKHVRPGGKYVPNFPIMGKVDVNGADTDPLFQWLKEQAPIPSDDPHAFVNDPKKIIWAPVLRSDVSWNFEKWLIGLDGNVIKRYSPKVSTIDIVDDIRKALSPP